MRKLVILRGAMGVGKTTFIKSKKLERFTLSSDQIRLMFNAPELTSQFSEQIPQYNNTKVWNLLYYLLEERMKKGEFTIVDAVHAKKHDFTIYKKLAKKYRYRLYVIDFTDVPKEEVLLRNEARESYKIVPKESIDRVYKLFSKEKVPSVFTVLKPNQWASIFRIMPQDFNHYRNIHIIGDIHGCSSALKNYFDQYPIREEDAYIFLGDYFDRGIENYSTYLLLTELINYKNIIFLLGNHEDKLYKYACDDEFKMDYDIKNTIEEFEQNGISKSDLRKFMQKLAQISYITFRNKNYLVTHGGIPYFPESPLEYYSTNSFVYGIDQYDVDIDGLYEEAMKKRRNKVYQVHGHRNYYQIDPRKYNYSYNLEGDIEHGGFLRILDLNDDGSICSKTVRNEIYNCHLKEETQVYQLVSNLRSNKYVYEKELEPGLSSFNFTKQAFYNQVWNQMTTQARGLFIDTKQYHVVARSYDKFFNINEREESSFENIKTSFHFPVSFYLKYNGFLGILSYYKGELFFATKSTNQGTYVEYFKTIFYTLFNEQQVDSIKDYLREHSVSMIFEVIDPIHDPHIIKYDEAHLILLDMVYNQLDYKKMPYQKLQKFADTYQIEVKRLVYVANQLEELETLYSTIQEQNYLLDHHNIEGFVLEDDENHIVKFKTDYYKQWKVLRTKMENAVAKNTFKTNSKNLLENEFMSYLKEKYENKKIDSSSLNIIKEREEFLKHRSIVV